MYVSVTLLTVLWDCMAQYSPHGAVGMYSSVLLQGAVCVYGSVPSPPAGALFLWSFTKMGTKPSALAQVTTEMEIDGAVAYCKAMQRDRQTGDRRICASYVNHEITQ